MKNVIIYYLALVLLGGCLAPARNRSVGVPVEDTIYARNFVLVGDKGEVRGALSARGGEPNLVLVDEKGEVRVTLGVSADKSCYLYLYDERGNPRAELVHKEATRLTLYGEKGPARAFLLVGREGAALDICDEKYKSRVALGVIGGEAMVAVRSGHGKSASVLLTREGEAGICVLDKEGESVWTMPPD